SQNAGPADRGQTARRIYRYFDGLPPYAHPRSSPCCPVLTETYFFSQTYCQKLAKNNPKEKCIAVLLPLSSGRLRVIAAVEIPFIDHFPAWQFALGTYALRTLNRDLLSPFLQTVH